jgi:hypothetical protein
MPRRMAYRRANRVVSLSKQERDNLMVQIYEWFHEWAPRYVDCHPIPASSYLEAASFQKAAVKRRACGGLRSRS